MAPFPGLRQELRGILSDSDEMTDLTTRLNALEESNLRIEKLLAKMAGGDIDDSTAMEDEVAEEGTPGEEP